MFKGNRSAIGRDRTVYTANIDGTLEIRGDKWKECPIEAGRGFCGRKNVKFCGDKGCNGCLKNPVRAKMPDQKQAMELAEEIERQMKS